MSNCSESNKQCSQQTKWLLQLCNLIYSYRQGKALPTYIPLWLEGLLLSMLFFTFLKFFWLFIIKEEKNMFWKINTMISKAFRILSLLPFFFLKLNISRLHRSRSCQKNAKLQISYLLDWSLHVCKDYGLVLLRTHYITMCSKCFSRAETQSNFIKFQSALL